MKKIPTGKQAHVKNKKKKSKLYWEKHQRILSFSFLFHSMAKNNDTDFGTTGFTLKF